MKVEKVTNHIKDLRYQKHQMSQQMLADLVGCSRQTINQLEQNKYAPSYVLVAKIAKVFDVTPESVIEVSLKQ